MSKNIYLGCDEYEDIYLGCNRYKDLYLGWDGCETTLLG